MIEDKLEKITEKVAYILPSVVAAFTITILVMLIAAPVQATYPELGDGSFEQGPVYWNVGAATGGRWMWGEGNTTAYPFPGTTGTAVPIDGSHM